MARFSSKEGYKAFDDAISTSQSECLFSLVCLLNLGHLSDQFGTSMTEVFERQL
jgi:hypothetical protein